MQTGFDYQISYFRDFSMPETILDYKYINQIYNYRWLLSWMLSREPVVLRQPLETESTEPLTELDNELLAKHKEYRYMPDKMTWDPNCYECKVRYRDPKAKDLVMYLHAWRYKVIYKLLYLLYLG